MIRRAPAEIGVSEMRHPSRWGYPDYGDDYMDDRSEPADVCRCGHGAGEHMRGGKCMAKTGYSAPGHQLGPVRDCPCTYYESRAEG